MRTRAIILAARNVRALRLVSPSRRERAQGMPDAGRTREPCVQKKCTFAHASKTGQPKQPASPAQWFTAYSALSSVSRASLPPSPADVVTRELDPSIAGSGPHAFAVRDAGARLAPSSASTASHRAYRDVRTPLLSGETGRADRPDLPDGLSGILPVGLLCRRRIFRRAAGPYETRDLNRLRCDIRRGENLAPRAIILDSARHRRRAGQNRKQRQRARARMGAAQAARDRFDQ